MGAAADALDATICGEGWADDWADDWDGAAAGWADDWDDGWAGCAAAIPGALVAVIGFGASLTASADLCESVRGASVLRSSLSGSAVLPESLAADATALAGLMGRIEAAVEDGDG